MVTGVSGNVGQGIIEGVRKSNNKYWVLGTDIAPYPLCAGYPMCDAGVQVPYAVDPEFIPVIKEVIRSNNIDYVLIGVDAEVLQYSKNKEEIERETGCSIIISDKGFVEIATDKYLTYLYLKEIRGINTPQTRTIMESPPHFIKYPMVAKPRRGHGSKGVQIINSHEEFKQAVKKYKNPMDICFQEYLDGEEYTCGLLFNKEHKLVDSIIMKRKLDCGVTVQAQIVEHAAIQDMIQNFATGSEKEKLFGSINLQIKMQCGVPYIHEINPRFSGTTQMRVAAGYNDVARILDNLAFGTPICKSSPKQEHLFRKAVVIEIEGEKC